VKIIDDNRVIVRARIEGSFKGIPFIYEDPADSDGSQYIWLDGETDSEKCSGYWLREGNMARDCNRRNYLPNNLKEDLDEPDCGHQIKIHKIIPLEGNYPTLLVDGYEDEW
jgi:hypothetical protein